MGLKFTPVIGRSLLGHSSMFRHFWDPYLVQTEGLTHLWIPTYPLTRSSPSHLPTPYNVLSVILQWFWKKLLKIQQCKLASRNSYKILAIKDCSSYAAYLAWLQSSTRELQWLEYLNSAFLEILNVITWSVFQNPVTYNACICMWIIVKCSNKSCNRE